LQLMPPPFIRVYSRITKHNPAPNNKRTLSEICLESSPVASTSRIVFPKLLHSINESYTYINRGPGSSVGIATDYGLDGPGSNPGGDEIFRPSRPTLGPTQSPVKWVPGVKCGRGVLLTTQHLLVPRSWKSRAKPLPTLWATPGL